MTTLYLITSGVLGLLLLALLLRPGGVRPISLWLLSALLPVLVSVTAALIGQAQATQALSGFDSSTQNRTLGWRDARGIENKSTLSLSGLDAACVVRVISHGGTYQLGSGELFVPRGAQLLGKWPTPEQANALMLSGQLVCRRVNPAGE